MCKDLVKTAYEIHKQVMKRNRVISLQLGRVLIMKVNKKQTRGEDEDERKI